MSEYDLSICIPARNEMFLAKTVENILENIEGNTEIIVGLDGAWAKPPIKADPRVTILYYGESVGQRCLTNRCVSLSTAKYVIKTDAHCSFDKGFDRKMLEAYEELPDGDNVTMVSTMRNLHAFDWVCKKCGNRWYQGRTPEHCCNDKQGKTKNDKCDSKEFKKDMKWIGKQSPQSNFYRFDKTMHFQYWKAFEKREEGKGNLCESLSLQGSFFMITRKKYWELDICEENFGSWGQQGVEVAMKTWMSGGRVVVNRNTWYAHMFRTQGGDFGFPYPQSGKQVGKAREYSRKLFERDGWTGAKIKFKDILKKFAPVPDWEVPKDSRKGIIYYTDNQLRLKIAKRVQKQLKEVGLPITSASLKPMDFGKNIHVKLDRCYLTMFKQILQALKHSENEIVYFCEHDVLYHPSHFDFTPPKKDVWYYNVNVYKVNCTTGHAVRTDDCRQVSGICVYRDLAIKHYTKRIELLENKQTELDFKFFNEDHKDHVELDKEFNSYIRKQGFEPGTHNRSERIDNSTSETWSSKECNVDIRHEKNLTSTKWRKEDFRNQKFTKGWKETDSIPYWGKVIID